MKSLLPLLPPLLCACSLGAGRLREDLVEKGCFLLEVPPFSPGSECASAVPWMARTGGVGCVTYDKATFKELERGIASGMPVLLRLDEGFAVARGRDRDQGLWILADIKRAERVVSDGWLSRHWTGWAGVGTGHVVTKE